MPPTLLTRGNLVAPKSASQQRQYEMKNAVPVDYIINVMQQSKLTAKSAGSRVFVLKAGTGSGKSTVFVPALAKMRGRIVAVTEPTRLTAEEICYDISRLLPDEYTVGETIGFQTGLINQAPRTGPLFMTPGILLNQLATMTGDAIIKKYSAVVIDEVHRHDLVADVALRLFKQFLEKNWNNPECPLLVLLSATMDERKYMDYFETENFFEVSGVVFPITERFPEAAVGNLATAIVDLCTTVEGDTLVFLPTKRMIEEVHELLDKQKPAKGKKRIVIEATGETIATGVIKEMIAPPAEGETRIALSTNVAETGLTLDSLENVIDTGMVNVVAFNPQYNCTVQAVQPVSWASAMQRRGRVGRKKPGAWYPLFTKDTFSALQPGNAPEIYMQDFSGDLLQLIISLTESTIRQETLTSPMYIESQLRFDVATVGLINPPSGESLQSGYEKLYELGLITRDWTPTFTGMMAARLRKLPVELARVILSAPYYGADIYQVTIIAAAVSIGGIGTLEGFTKAEMFDDQLKSRCDFTRVLIAYEHLQRRVKTQQARHLSANFIREFAEKRGVAYRQWILMIELVYELVFQLMELGIRVDMNNPPLIDTLEHDPVSAQATIVNIKKCVVEGYRLNVASWNEITHSYVMHYKYAPAAWRNMPHDDNPPLNIVTNSVTYRNVRGKMSYEVGSFVSVLDDYVEPDRHYMY